MSDAKPTFQQMNGCAACKHTAAEDPGGRCAALGKSYWCVKLGKAVDARDGAACPAWEYGG